MQPDPGDDEAGFLRAAPWAENALPRLHAYRNLLQAWSGRFNLIGPSVLPSFWTRHVLDSAQLLTIAPAALRWTDIGAGAGFPGLVLAILLHGRAGAHVHLIESMAKRCRFLKAVVDTLKLSATVHHARAESLAFAVDVVTARACAPLGRLLGYAEPHLALSAQGLFLKGRDAQSELTQARAQWRLGAELLPSLSDPEGSIVRVTQLERA